MPTMPRDPVSTVRAAVKRHADALGPSLFGLACSGGADSMALADAAIAECGVSNVLVIHVDHGLAPGSARVGEELSAWMRERGVAAVVRGVTIAPRASLEAAAREARYEALAAVAREVGCRWIFLAHTRRDQAETVLMRAVRGTGLAGLAGIPVLRDNLVRPLLELPREMIEAYVAARGLPTWVDPMNDDDRFTRVRFRKRHIPGLRAENPAVEEALARLAAIARESHDALRFAARSYRDLPLSCRALLEMPVGLRRHIYASVLTDRNLVHDATHIEAIDALVTRPPHGEQSIDLPDARVVRMYDALDIEDLVDLEDDEPPAPSQELALVAPAGHTIRRWQPGDRMKPARLKGRSRKLSDLYIDAKVPRRVRASARVVIRTADGVIVWAEHLGLAHGETNAVVPLPSRRGEAF